MRRFLSAAALVMFAGAAAAGCGSAASSSLHSAVASKASAEASAHPSARAHARASARAEAQALARQRVATQAKVNLGTCEAQGEKAMTGGALAAYLKFRGCVEAFYPRKPHFWRTLLRCSAPAAFAYFRGPRTPADLNTLNGVFGNCASAAA